MNLINAGELPATIGVYHTAGGPNPIAQLSEPSVTKGIGVAVDSHHNLFRSNTTELWSGGQVVEFVGGTMPGIVLNATKIGTDTPGGVLLDRSDNMLLPDQNTAAIYIYAPPYNAPPFATIHLMGTTLFCALGLQERRLYCLDYEYGAVDVYAYPSGKYLYSFTNGIQSNLDPEGIAIQPQAPALH